MSLKYFTSSIYPIIALLALLLPPAHAQIDTGLTNIEIQQFCEEKPIWAGLGIEAQSCITASTYCAAKAEFEAIDPVVLSEPFYLCVFQQLGISVD